MDEQPQHDQTSHDDAAELHDEPTPTLRRSLKDRRAKAVGELFLDRPVPRLEPQVWVRFKPIGSARIEAINKAAAKSKDPDKNVVGNARALAESCIGLFEKIDGELRSLDPDDDRAVQIPDDPKATLPPIPDDWPRFDESLARLLGVPFITATNIVRELYLTDGDIVSEAGELTVWSGYAGHEIDEEFAGN